jgi:polynucleotide 5'-hydroxyl-kinase GRC3/NOL9
MSGRTIRVRAGKALPFEPGVGCRLRVRLGRGGRTWKAPPEEAGVLMWHGVARRVLELAADRKIKVMVAGDSDTGKSTLAAYLANLALARGLVPCVVDGDIGQGDLAPPAAVGASALHEQVTDLRDAGASMFEFVGSTSPAGFERVVAEKLKSLADKAGPLGDIIIINTDGYVGAQYKLMLAAELHPDAIVCLGNPELLGALQGGPWQVLAARASSQAWKTRRERTNRRLDQFLRHVGAGASGAELSQIRFAYMDRIYSPSDLARPPIMQLEPENMDRMFVGLGAGGAVAGFGIVTEISQGEIRVQTDLDQFDTVHLSNIRLANKPVEVRIA